MHSEQNDPPKTRFITLYEMILFTVQYHDFANYIHRLGVPYNTYQNVMNMSDQPALPRTGHKFFGLKWLKLVLKDTPHI